MLVELLLVSILAFSSADDVGIYRPASGLPIAIPDNGYPTNAAALGITVPAPSNPNFRVKDIQILLQTNHSNVGDLRCLVQSPGSIQTYFLYRAGLNLTVGVVGTCVKQGGNITFSEMKTVYIMDNFCTSYGTVAPLASPITVLPYNPLSAYYNVSQSGTWIVACYDAQATKTGAILDTALTITSGLVPTLPYVYSAPVPQTIPNNNVNGVSFSVTVSDNFIIRYMEIDAYIKHTYMNEVTFAITHLETGTTAYLLQNPQIGRTYVTGNYPCIFGEAGVTFTDETQRFADHSCNLFIPCIAGRSAPRDPLSLFYGESTLGTWMFTAWDEGTGGTGNVTSAVLKFDTVDHSDIKCPHDPYEPNNYAYETYSIDFPPAGQTTTLNISACNSGDYEWFRFLAGSNTTLRFTLTQNPTDIWFMYVFYFNPADLGLYYLAIVEDASNPKVAQISVTAGNTYYIWVMSALYPVSIGNVLRVQNLATPVTSGRDITTGAEVTTGARRQVTTGEVTTGQVTSGSVTSGSLTTSPLTTVPITSGVVTSGLPIQVTTGAVTTGLSVGTSTTSGSASSSSTSSSSSVEVTTGMEESVASGAESLIISVLVVLAGLMM